MDVADGQYARRAVLRIQLCDLCRAYGKAEGEAATVLLMFLVCATSECDASLLGLELRLGHGSGGLTCDIWVDAEHCTDEDAVHDLRYELADALMIQGSEEALAYILPLRQHVSSAVDGDDEDATRSAPQLMRGPHPNARLQALQVRPAILAEHAASTQLARHPASASAPVTPY